MKNLKWGALALAATFSLGACQNQPSTEDVNEGPAGISLADMDTTVRPADDFYRFANGGWLERTEVPADEGRWSSFNELREFNNEALLTVLNNASESGKYGEGSDEMKAFTFYQVAMDSAKAEEAGIKPLQPTLKEIDAISNKEDLRKQLAELRLKGVSPFFGMYVTTDRKQSDQMAMHVGQGGLGLPNRDYYTKGDSKSEDIKEKYVAFIADMLGFIGYEATAAQQAAQNIILLENKLAQASMDNVERRNPIKTYNKFDIQALDQHTPNFNWSAYFNQLGVEGVDSVIVGQPDFFKEMDRIIANTDLSTLKDYMKYNVINDAAAYLNHEIVNRNFEFYGKTLQGTEEMRPRWKRALASTNGAVGFAVGKLYVDETFPPEAKQQAEEMVEYIKKAFANRINNLEWMSPETKEKAQDKLSRFNVKIGYPEEWETYEDLEVSESSYVENVMASNRYSVKDNLSKLGKPVDKDEWFMTPQTVNAYYSPTFNEIVFPAGILQPPFYNFKADAAVNFGGIGAVIGHEISHGFDDNGSRYDGEGNMKNWWTEEDNTQFQARTGQLASQYDAYEPLDSVFVNGKFTLGENIGDLGGVAAAYDGLLLYLADNESEDQIQGYTPEQRFFISWATIWRSKYKDEALRNQVMTDPHSPGMYRATGPLVNIDGFYEAFNIQEGDPMYKADSARVRIW
jgi:putative endopeptidase